VLTIYLFSSQDEKWAVKAERRLRVGHSYMVAAFCITWAVQLGYVLWMLVKWQGQKGKSSIGK
jgi:hypothetical protein